MANACHLHCVAGEVLDLPRRELLERLLEVTRKIVLREVVDESFAHEDEVIFGSRDHMLAIGPQAHDLRVLGEARNLGASGRIREALLDGREEGSVLRAFVGVVGSGGGVGPPSYP